ncbi:nineteen complex-related protein 2-domain-containing protein [Aspergillus bertholletiae]|uniref:Nineteen complex-related protein 2-domain-containing protein n=1 Tax=Aspergillus bertholletiae TaxID=1226010 RepID=A0A5N7BL47_9EURO|nr:nineteen complex-related protein 2-domain-containing protein [Aspergillus bertholletiae]
MSSKFANRRKPRKIGGDDDEDNGEQDIGPVVKRPASSKTKQKSKTHLSFGPGETSMAEDGEQESEVVIPKRQGLGRRALEKSAFQRSLTPSGSGNQLPLRVGPEQDRPSYSNEYLKELRNSTPSTPNNATDDDKEKAIDVAAKFGEVMKVTAPAAIPSEAEIREKKERRARLAKEQQYGISTERDFISLDDTMADEEWNSRNEKEDLRDTRLIRDDEDFAEGFDEFVEDGRITLGRKAERERAKKQRDEMRELIEDAEGVSDEDDSDLEEKAAYEAAQTKAAMGHSGREFTDRPKTPPKMTSLPRLSTCLDRLRTTLAVIEKSKAQMIDRMEELRKEKADIAVREVEIQALIKEAGDNYEKLKQEAGRTPGSDEDTAAERGLESIGNSVAVSTGNSEDES